MEQPVVGHPAADTEWPPLPKTDVEQLSATDLRQHLPTSKDGSGKTTTSTEDLAAPGDAPVSQEVNGSEIIRKKKMRLEKAVKALMKGNGIEPGMLQRTKTNFNSPTHYITGHGYSPNRHF